MALRNRFRKLAVGRCEMNIRMIAEKCGCSTATVSKALNGAEDVSRETAERVRRIAAELGYMPNAAARSMRTSRSYCFGVLFQDAGTGGLGHGFFSGILNSFRDRAAELGYDIFFISDRLGQRKFSCVEHARYRSCDGVFIPNDAYDSFDIRGLAASDIPLVTVDYAFEDCGSVLSDNVKGMADLVKYIYRMGHRRIAFIHGDDTTVTRTRVYSFRKVCRELGLEVPAEYLVEGSYCRPAASEEATRRLLALKDRPTCIIYPDDIAYIGGRNEIYRQGLRLQPDAPAPADHREAGRGPHGLQRRRRAGPGGGAGREVYPQADHHTRKGAARGDGGPDRGT